MSPDALTDALRRALADLVEDAAQRRLEPRWRRPRAEVGGDWSTGIALALAAELGRPAAELAAELATRLALVEGMAEARVTGPGFVTLTLEAPGTVAGTILDRGPAFLRTEACAGKRVHLERSPRRVHDLRDFRVAATAEALHRLLAAAGAEVTSSPGRGGPIRLTTHPPRAGGDAQPVDVVVGPVGVDPPSTDPGDELMSVVGALGADPLRLGLLRTPVAEPVVVPIAQWRRRTEASPFGLLLAHARAAREERAAAWAGAPEGTFDPSLLADPRDVALCSLLADAPRVAGRAAAHLEAELLVRHLERIAAEFLSWVAERGLSGADLAATEPGHLAAARARARLAEATKVVLAAGLDLLDVEAPDRL